MGKSIAESQSRDVCAEVYLPKVQEAVNVGVPAFGPQLCDEAVSHHPAYRRINALEELKQDILSLNFTVQTPPAVYPGEEFDLKASLKDLKSFTVQPYAVDLSVRPNIVEASDKTLLKKHGHSLSSVHYALFPSGDYKMQGSIFHMKAPETGLYAPHIVSNAEVCSNSVKFLSSIHFKVLTCSLPSKLSGVAVLDDMSGKPVRGVSLSVFDRQNK